MKQRFKIILAGRDDHQPAVVRLRPALKLLLRGFRLRCVEAREVAAETQGDGLEPESDIVTVGEVGARGRSASNAATSRQWQRPMRRSATRGRYRSGFRPVPTDGLGLWVGLGGVGSSGPTPRRAAKRARFFW